jgi:hypothetical protein
VAPQQNRGKSTFKRFISKLFSGCCSVCTTDGTNQDGSNKD